MSALYFDRKIFLIENKKLKNQTKKQELEFLRQGLKQKSLVIWSIIHFYTHLTEKIALRLRLLLSTSLKVSKTSRFYV